MQHSVIQKVGFSIFKFWSYLLTQYFIIFTLCWISHTKCSLDFSENVSIFLFLEREMERGRLTVCPSICVSNRKTNVVKRRQEYIWFFFTLHHESKTWDHVTPSWKKWVKKWMSGDRKLARENLERCRYEPERRGMKVSCNKTVCVCVCVWEREEDGTVRLQGEGHHVLRDDCPGKWNAVEEVKQILAG